MAELTYRDAVVRGIAQEMERDPDVVFLGEDIGKAGGAFVYLGVHAVHGEWKQRGAGAALYPAFTGIAGLGVLRLLGWVG